MKNFYELEAELPSGKKVKLEEYKGKVIIIANTASKCGLTYQYAGLEELYKRYSDRGLVVLGFPCNQFANQEPGTDEEIKQNCLINYGVTFPVFKKIDVNGENTHEIFSYLKENTFSLFGSKIKWNFTKFIISKDGKTIKRFAPVTKPEKLEKLIVKFLEK
ncbi:MAG: glutathione peroxidase [Candidatus Gracilibacteria bacterium]|nr:glutathione peroxidase [Candidatus Gracilibacteria bacterium]